jgi:hypothetical protein
MHHLDALAQQRALARAGLHAASVCCKFDSWPRTSALLRTSISSSGKSSVASISMRSWIRPSASAWISRENAPASERLAERAALSVLASIRSASPPRPAPGRACR